MDYKNLLSILEVILLAAVFIYLFRFVFMNYASRIRKPMSWIKAVKAGNISPALLKAEKKYPDRIRFYNLWLQIQRIEQDGIEGSLAELGVYKGDTARIMHLCAPERDLHLFDTFKGFPADDLQNETGKAAGYTTQHFADTSIEKVKSRIGAHQNIIYHNGYFPETTHNCQHEAFALVSMDADLHNPTKAGLEFFYPRLSEGGVILIHDYNSDWPELVKATDDFCAGIPETRTPVPDADSTVMIIKNK
ncbi:MAG: TylF/MycF/NovP-related O-methyltransferase [Bacteroidota bacterium]